MTNVMAIKPRNGSDLHPPIVPKRGQTASELDPVAQLKNPRSSPMTAATRARQSGGFPRADRPLPLSAGATTRS